MMTAEEEIAAALLGSTLVAGADVMTKEPSGLWHRPSDDALFDSEWVADFHGHSGYSIVPPAAEGEQNA